MFGLTELPTITRLDLAVVELPDTHPAATTITTTTTTRSSSSVPVFGYCIHHPDGPILVDTGVGYGNKFIDDLYHPQRVDIGQLLDRSGVEIDEVVAVVNSHLHFDHCGQNPSLFDSGAVFYAQAVELETVENDRFYTDASWAMAPSERRRAVKGDEQIADGVTILATPGHTSGHQSVLVEADGRRVVIGAQIVWHADELSNEIASAANVDPDPQLQSAAVDSIRRIKALRPEVIHLSHCTAFSPPPPPPPLSDTNDHPT